jgi:hypothetical protein
MQQNDKQNLKIRFDQYQPSKTQLFWACAGSVVIATVIGFTWGGWVTGGTARDMAENAAAQGRQQVAAVVCVDRFMAAADAGAQLAALKEISSSYQRDKFVEDGGWAIMRASTSEDGGSAGPSSSRDQREAAELCADELVALEVPVSGEAELINDGATVAQ